MSERDEALERLVQELRGEVARLSAKQRKTTRWSRAAGLVLLGACLVVFGASRRGGAQEPGASQKEITAGRITIVGADGKPRLQLDSDADGGRIQVRSAAGDSVVLVSVDKDGGYLSVRDAGNKGAAILANTKSGGLVNVYNKDDKAVVIMTPYDSGNGAIETYDAKRKLRTQLGSDDTGGRLWLMDANETVRAKYP